MAFSPFIGFVTVLSLTPLLLIVARRYQLYERPDERKVHDGNVPALGGVAMTAGFFTALIIGWAIAGERVFALGTPREAYGIIALGLIFMHVLGVVDDAVDIPARYKFCLQCAGALILVFGGAIIRSFQFPGSELVVPLGPLAVPVSVFWIVSVANAVNLVDGIDGYAGGLTVTAAAGIGIVALLSGNVFASMAAFVLVGVVLGFLVFNFPPARIFMGDGGSLFLGSALAVLGITGPVDAHGVVVITVPLLVLSVPILDTAAAIVRRRRDGRKIHEPDRQHLHHLLLDHTGSRRRALLPAYAIFFLVAVAAVLYAHVNVLAGITLGVSVLLAVLVGYIRLCGAARRNVKQGKPRFTAVSREPSVR